MIWECGTCGSRTLILSAPADRWEVVCDNGHALIPSPLVLVVDGWRVALAEGIDASPEDIQFEPSEAELVRYYGGREPGYDPVDHQHNLDAGRPGL